MAVQPAFHAPAMLSIMSLVQSIIGQKPRSYIQLLENYQRLLRLEVEKRRATIESATELDTGAGREIVDGLQRWCFENRVKKITDLIGTLEA